MSLEFIKPQLASPVDHPPPRAGWIHEVKHDGYRTLLNIEGRKATPAMALIGVNVGNAGRNLNAPRPSPSMKH
jgi:hypothetical protein